MSAASTSVSPGPLARPSAAASDAHFLRLVGQHRPIGPHRHFNSIPVLVALSKRRAAAIKREPEVEELEQQLEEDEDRDGDGDGGRAREQTVELHVNGGEGAEVDVDGASSPGRGTLDGHVIRLWLEELYDVRGLEELEEAATRTQFGLRSDSASRSPSPETTLETSMLFSNAAPWKHPRLGSGLLRLAGVGGRSRASTSSSALDLADANGSARAQTPLGHSLLHSAIAKGSRHEFGLPFDDGFDELVHARRVASAGSAGKHNISSDDELSDLDPDHEHGADEAEGSRVLEDVEQSAKEEEEMEVEEKEEEDESEQEDKSEEKPRRTRGPARRSSKRRKVEKEAGLSEGVEERDEAQEEGFGEEEEEADEDEDEEDEEEEGGEEEEDENEEEGGEEMRSARSSRRGRKSTAEHDDRKRTRSNRSSTTLAQPAAATKVGSKRRGQADAPHASSVSVEQAHPSKSTRSSTAPRRSTRR